MGVNWASTLLALVALVLCPMPFLFYKYGPLIRSKSQFAPCIVSFHSLSDICLCAQRCFLQDLKIAKELELEQQKVDEKEKGMQV